MTSDNLLKFLGNREYLHQVSYQELKSMVVQYPYSLSLRYLLAMKSQQEDNTDLDRNIELLATYGIDRSHLHRIFTDDPIVLEDLEESIIMGEDFLELKELSTLERDLDKKLAIQEINDLTFIREENQTNSTEISLPEPVHNRDIVSPIINTNGEPEEVGVVEQLESAQEEPTLPPINQNLIENETTEVNLEESANESIQLPKEEIVDQKEFIEEIEEEFITMDFEEAEVLGETTSSSELVPSASFSAEEILDNQGLPEDAVEVNDLYPELGEPVVDDALVETFFQEAEEEAMAEPAASDSIGFIDNPEELLTQESELIAKEINETEISDELEDLTTSQELPTEKEETPHESEETVTKITNNFQEIEKSEISREAPIPFEVEYSEADPITITSIQKGTEIILPEEQKEHPKEVVPEETEIINNTDDIVEKADGSTSVEPEVIEEVAETKRTKQTTEKEQLVKPTFKFDSLDRLEASFTKKEKLLKPAPKVKFNSWQEQFSGVNPFSSANLSPLNKGKGRTIKRKRKTNHKEFEKTVAFAEESLELDTALISETLAQLLVQQGQYSKARKMYEQLSLIMPKKSSFFAAEIEKIQNLPDEDS